MCFWVLARIIGYFGNFGKVSTKIQIFGSKNQATVEKYRGVVKLWSEISCWSALIAPKKIRDIKPRYKFAALIDYKSGTNTEAVTFLVAYLAYFFNQLKRVTTWLPGAMKNYQ